MRKLLREMKIYTSAVTACIFYLKIFFFVNLTLSVVHTGTREGATVKIKNMETTEQKLSFFLKTESEQISFSETYNEFMVWKSLKNFIFAIIAQKIIFHRVE